MSAGVQTKVQAGPAQSFTPAGTGLLQRECTLSNTPGLVGERSKRDEEELTPQRSPAPVVQNIVYEAIRSPGKPLDSNMRIFMESGFGYDFSQVKVHDNSLAAESAQALNANAFTVGQHIVFGAGQYTPNSSLGQRLLAHELTHVVQVGDYTGMAIAIAEPGNHWEKEAESAAASINANQSYQVVSRSPALVHLNEESYPPSLPLQEPRFLECSLSIRDAILQHTAEQFSGQIQGAIEGLQTLRLTEEQAGNFQANMRRSQQLLPLALLTWIAGTVVGVTEHLVRIASSVYNIFENAGEILSMFPCAIGQLLGDPQQARSLGVAAGINFTRTNIEQLSSIPSDFISWSRFNFEFGRRFGPFIVLIVLAYLVTGVLIRSLSRLSTDLMQNLRRSLAPFSRAARPRPQPLQPVEAPPAVAPPAQSPTTPSLGPPSTRSVRARGGAPQPAQVSQVVEGEFGVQSPIGTTTTPPAHVSAAGGRRWRQRFSEQELLFSVEETLGSEGGRGVFSRARLFRPLQAERARLGIPPAGSAGDTYTIGRLEIGGRSWMGRNGHGMSAEGILEANSQTLTHAEGHVFIQAASEVRPEIMGQTARLIVDNQLCSYCIRSDGVLHMARQLGIRQLTIVEPDAITIFNLAD